MFKIFAEIAGIKLKIESEFEIKKIDGFTPFIKDDENYDISYKIYDVADLSDEIIKNSKILYSYSSIMYVCYKNEYYRVIKLFEKYTYIKFDPENLNDFKIYTPVDDERALPYLKDLVCFDLPLLKNDAMQLHSSFVKYKNRAILFSAPSGTGKSTQANLWKENTDCEILNGDRTILRKIGGEWLAFGSPWAGSSGIYRDDHAIAPAVFIIRRSKENKITPLTPRKAVALLLSEVQVQPWNQESAEKICALIEDFVSKCSVNLFECRPDKDAVKVVKDFLFK